MAASASNWARDRTTGAPSWTVTAVTPMAWSWPRTAPERSPAESRTAVIGVVSATARSASAACADADVAVKETTCASASRAARWAAILSAVSTTSSLTAPPS